MAAAESVFLKARGRTLTAFRPDAEYQWKGPFYFIQGADPQFGLMKAWTHGDTNNGDDEWGEEIKLAEQAVQAVNKLNPKPKFFVLCGDLVHGMPGTRWKKNQEQDLKNVLKNTDQDIPLHIPLFLSQPDEDDDYFNLEKSVRQEIMEKFHKAGIRAVFSGHYHRNAGGSYKGLEMVVSSAIGCQLGQDTHGLRVVVVTEEKVVHRYYSLTDLGSHGLEKELLDMLAKQK
uniref:serine/threonine-protein phosphatase CPPED1 isoform X3 n=1 Tax=Agelaius phoeniceus TaxID=39638 RepID=UPI0023EBC58C|nr:serine/threonine-protein phosphatase CPPED1 isoform X3 [Agelaius phoeniceus]